MQQWECIVCGWIYDEAVGDPNSGIAPGTKFEDIPDDWLCPECGVGKEDFELVDIPSLDGSTSNTLNDTSKALPATNDSQAETPIQAIPVSSSVSVDPIIIIGSGLAGYGLLKEIRKIDTVCPITIICKDDGRVYSKPALSTGYTKQSDEHTLTQADALNTAHQYNASILTLTEVSAIDSEAQTVSLEAGKGILHYAKLVLALGADCIKPPLSGDALERVFTINDLMDFARFQDNAKQLKAKRVAIIGAGLIGCEYANDLSNGGFQVESIDPMATCLPTLLPTQAGQAVQRSLEALGVQFHFGHLAKDVSFAEHDAGQTVDVTLNDGNKINADLVLSAIGVRPRIQLAENNGIDVNRGIKTNRFLETSTANIYAVGDCAEVQGLVLVYIAPLFAGVRALAKSLTGTPTKVNYPAMPISIKTPACPVVVCPPPHGSTGNWTIVQEQGDNLLAEFENAQGETLGFALTGSYVSERNRLQASLPDLL